MGSYKDPLAVLKLDCREARVPSRETSGKAGQVTLAAPSVGLPKLESGQGHG